ncbi:hypothetical protein DFJ63DRAFT_285112 [Scheffersomyces coipomensis]|uniref:uncharacterized protein n=1 Tax=Scheffersomyces coipomensis TaxID=1788519 RepID=UPI00315D9AD6
MESEKDLSPFGQVPKHTARSRLNRIKIIVVSILALTTVLFSFSSVISSNIQTSLKQHGDNFEAFQSQLSDIFRLAPSNPDGLCPIPKKVNPLPYLYNNQTLHKILHDKDFQLQSREKIIGAVKIPTEVYDNMINPNGAETHEELYKLEPLWENFEKLHHYFEQTFPLVHKHLKVDKVNKFALVFTWEGTADKKPILLTAHQDVVPVQKETIDLWTYPPFEGGYDGKFLYGRGVSDCKNLLVGLLETIELLLSEGEFKPERTIILGFGYDEESDGTGAGEISKFLQNKYGTQSLVQIIDEGTTGFTEVEGLKVILPSTSEKGYLDAVIELYTPGGHSSVPPDHTSIGILAQLINKIEDVQFDSIITNANPLLQHLQCIAEHSDSIDIDIKKSILKAHLDQSSNSKVMDYITNQLHSKYLITTSQAIDIISGGVKSNALPEHVSVLVNHRIAVEESVKTVTDKLIGQIEEVATKFDLGIIFDNKEIKKPTINGYFNFTPTMALEPSPVTPASGGSWDIFTGSLRYLYEDLVGSSNETIIASPYVEGGNTDTKSYWDLTPNIFRYEPGIHFSGGHAHSVDERLILDSHYYIIAFYYYYLQVTDTLTDEFFAT